MLRMLSTVLTGNLKINCRFISAYNKTIINYIYIVNETNHFKKEMTMNKSIASLLARFTAKQFSSVDAQLKLYFWMIESSATLLGKFIKVSDADAQAVQTAKAKWEDGKLSDDEKKDLAERLKLIVDGFEVTAMSGLTDCIKQNPDASIQELVSETPVEEPVEEPEQTAKGLFDQVMAVLIRLG